MANMNSVLRARALARLVTRLMKRSTLSVSLIACCDHENPEGLRSNSRSYGDAVKEYMSRRSEEQQQCGVPNEQKQKVRKPVEGCVLRCTGPTVLRP